MLTDPSISMRQRQSTTVTFDANNVLRDSRASQRKLADAPVAIKVKSVACSAGSD